MSLAYGLYWLHVFWFELQVHFFEKKSFVIPQNYVLLILVDRNISCVIDIIEILLKIRMDFTLVHHIKHQFWTQEFSLYFAFSTNWEYTY